MPDLYVSQTAIHTDNPAQRLEEGFSGSATALLESNSSFLVCELQDLRIDDDTTQIRVFDGAKEVVLYRDDKGFQGYEIREASDGVRCAALPSRSLCFGELKRVENRVAHFEEDRVRPYVAPMNSIAHDAASGAIGKHLVLNYVEYVGWDEDGQAMIVGHRLVDFGLYEESEPSAGFKQ